MRIYTRGGDDGSTGLLGGKRVSKADPQVEAYGAVDELNAVLGWVLSAAPPDAVAIALREVQPACFRLGAVLATGPGADAGVEAPSSTDVARLEEAIDALDAELPQLKTFVLPGGAEWASRLHVARTTCRRAERIVVGAAERVQVPEDAVRWLNRLSDLLFVQARFANQVAGVADVPWQPGRDS